MTCEPLERIESIIPVPHEWDNNSDIYLKVGTILNSPLVPNAQLKLKLSYKGFLKTENITNLAPYYTSTITKTYPSPTQYDFSEFVFSITKDNIINKIIFIY